MKISAFLDIKTVEDYKDKLGIVLASMEEAGFSSDTPVSVDAGELGTLFYAFSLKEYGNEYQYHVFRQPLTVGSNYYVLKLETGEVIKLNEKPVVSIDPLTVNTLLMLYNDGSKVCVVNMSDSFYFRGIERYSLHDYVNLYVLSIPCDPAHVSAYKDFFYLDSILLGYSGTFKNEESLLGSVSLTVNSLHRATDTMKNVSVAELMDFYTELATVVNDTQMVGNVCWNPDEIELHALEIVMEV